MIVYSADSNKCAVWNNHAGYYIGLFGHYIKNHVIFNKFFWKKSKNNNRACTLIRNCKVNLIHISSHLDRILYTVWGSEIESFYINRKAQFRFPYILHTTIAISRLFWYDQWHGTFFRQVCVWLSLQHENQSSLF